MRNFLLRTAFPRVYFAMAGDAGGGGGGGQADADAGGTGDDGDVKPVQDPDKSNIQDNVDNFGDLWQAPKDEADPLLAKDVDPAVKKTEEAKVLKDYIDKIDFMGGVDLSKITEELSAGSTEALQGALTAVAKSTYQRALVDANKVIEARVNKAVEEAVASSRNNVHGDLAVQSMEAQLTFTKDPAIAPIAKAVLAQLMRKGQDAPTAIDNVKKYFLHTRNISAKALGIARPPRGRGKIQNADPNDFADSDDLDDIDWMETLTG